MSASHRRLGALAEKPRPTRSAGPLSRRGRDSRAPVPAPGPAGQAHLAHEPRHSAAAYLGALPG